MTTLNGTVGTVRSVIPVTVIFIGQCLGLHLKRLLRAAVLTW